jgi:hypothetical protein
VPSLQEVIDAQQMELRCPHCAHIDVCTLGWVRDHSEKVCSACEEIIVLGTSEILKDIRDIGRVFRELDASLHKDLHCWSVPGANTATPAHGQDVAGRRDRSSTSSQRLEPIMQGLDLVQGLLDDCLSSSDPERTRFDAKAALALYASLKPLAQALLDASGNLPELRTAMGNIEKRLATLAPG